VDHRQSHNSNSILRILLRHRRQDDVDNSRSNSPRSFQDPALRANVDTSLDACRAAELLFSLAEARDLSMARISCSRSGLRTVGVLSFSISPRRQGPI
jgi:hypothetical protein